MKKSSLSALVAGPLAGGLPTANAFAADLGGTCCADLEERIAAHEATTVRKGNRKFSLPMKHLYRSPLHGGPRTEHVSAPSRGLAGRSHPGRSRQPLRSRGFRECTWVGSRIDFKRSRSRRPP
jgi:hypothetical protein